MSFLGYYIKSTNRKCDSILLIGFCVNIWYESFLAMLQAIFHSSLGGVWYFLGERTFNAQTPGIANANIQGALFLRPYATFPHPNVLAGFFVFSMLFILQKEVIKRNMLLHITLLVGTLGLLLTLSRLAIAFWFIFLLCFCIGNFFKTKRRHSLTSLGFFFIVLIGLLVTPVAGRFSSSSLSEGSMFGRQLLINASLSIIRHNPLFGVGIGNFLLSLQPVPMLGNTFLLQPVHNIFLLVFADVGIVGMLVFLWFIIRTILYLHSQKQLFSFFPAAAILFFLLIGFFDHYFLTLQQGQLLSAIMFGYSWTRVKK